MVALSKEVCGVAMWTGLIMIEVSLIPFMEFSSESTSGGTQPFGGGCVDLSEAVSLHRKKAPSESCPFPGWQAISISGKR